MCELGITVFDALSLVHNNTRKCVWPEDFAVLYNHLIGCEDDGEVWAQALTRWRHTARTTYNWISSVRTVKLGNSSHVLNITFNTALFKTLFILALDGVQLNATPQHTCRYLYLLTITILGHQALKSINRTCLGWMEQHHPAPLPGRTTTEQPKGFTFQIKLTYRTHQTNICWKPKLCIAPCEHVTLQEDASCWPTLPMW